MGFEELAKQIAEEFERGKILSLNDAVDFDKNACFDCGGICCFNPEVILTPYDIYRLIKGGLLKRLGVSLKEFIAKFCVAYIGKYSRIPLVMLGKNPETGACWFLAPVFDRNEKVVKGKLGRPMFLCCIHAYKPMKCKTYPLGRIHSFDEKKKINKVGFVQPKRNECLGTKRGIKVPIKTFLGSDAKNLRYADESMGVMIEASELVREVEKIDKTAVEVAQNALTSILYGVVGVMTKSSSSYSEIASIQLKMLAEIKHVLCGSS